MSRFQTREEWLRWLDSQPARPRTRLAARLPDRDSRGVRPGELGSHAVWNAKRLHGVIRRLPDSPLRRSLQQRLVFELERIDGVLADE